MICGPDAEHDGGCGEEPSPQIGGFVTLLDEGPIEKNVRRDGRRRTAFQSTIHFLLSERTKPWIASSSCSPPPPSR